MPASSQIYVLDACAVIAFLRDEPGADVVRSILSEPTHRCRLHAVNVCEVCYDAMRRGDADAADALLATLAAVGIEIWTACDADLWQQAAGLKARFRRISLADCFALALAMTQDATLVTSDHHEFDQVAASGACPILFIR